jgi:UDP-glucose 4-epimerase
MEALYYKVNRDLTLEVARKAKEAGVKQFIFMSSMIVFHESRSLTPEMLTADTQPCPNGFYGDSKLQAENGLHELACNTFKICILRPPMIYGKGSKGNFPRLIRLAAKTPVFPEFHNRRSMLYIDNLAEFVLQAIVHQLSGTFYPQNRELSDTVELIRYFAQAQNHRIWITKSLNPLVRLASLFLQPINKLFGTYYYASEMSQVDFEYQLVSLEESLKRIM